MKTSRKLFLSAVAVSALGLGGLLVTNDDATAADNSAKASDPLQFARGAQTWADNCARCHNMRSPKELRDEQWRAVMAHMRVRAGLTGDEARDILAFLQGSN